MINAFDDHPTEKNPGLFLQMAHELLRLHPFVRFTVVGDGVLRASLEDLAARLQISWAVHFAGWAGGDDLPGVLAGVDVVVNPSLRAWSETFCIANIEAMSMEVPLVTFAVGGVGEYVRKPSQDEAEHDALFSVSENAVVVHRATPEAIAAAVHHLVLRPELRRALGQAGRQTVLTHFTVSRQMSQYAQLYARLTAGGH
jgi:glycosyltransferase involved in cell wall biosynthesis